MTRDTVNIHSSISFNIKCCAREYSGNIVKVKLPLIPGLLGASSGGTSNPEDVQVYRAFCGCENYSWRHRVCLLCQRATNEYVYCLSHHLEADSNVFNYVIPDSLLTD